LCRCGVVNMARQTVEIDNELWQRFLKKLVDIYGSAYGSTKKEALNEAIRLWLDVKEATSPLTVVSKEASELMEKKDVSPAVMKLLGEEETVIPLGAERRLVVEALKVGLR